MTSFQSGIQYPQWILLMQIMQLGCYPLHKSTGVESQVSDAAAILHGSDSMLHLLNDLEQLRLIMGAFRWSWGSKSQQGNLLLLKRVIHQDLNSFNLVYWQLP